MSDPAHAEGLAEIAELANLPKSVQERAERLAAEAPEQPQRSAAELVRTAKTTEALRRRVSAIFADRVYRKAAMRLIDSLAGAADGPLEASNRDSPADAAAPALSIQEPRRFHRMSGQRKWKRQHNR